MKRKLRSMIELLKEYKDAYFDVDGALDCPGWRYSLSAKNFCLLGTEIRVPNSEICMEEWFEETDSQK